MKVTAQSADLFHQIQEILDGGAVTPDNVVERAATAKIETAEQPAVVAAVVEGIQGKITSPDALRLAIADALISMQLDKLGAAGDAETAKLTRELLSNDPVFSRLVDQTILATTRMLASE